MKKWVITTTIFLSAIFIMMPKVNAQIVTEFGNFPDAPTDYYNHVVSKYLIMQDKADTSNVQMFALGPSATASGSRPCSYSSIATSDPNFMWLNGVRTSGTSSCYGNYYILQNNQWVWQSYIATETNAIPINGINRLGNKPYTDYNIATTINFTYNGNVLLTANSGFAVARLFITLEHPTSFTANLKVILDDVAGKMGSGGVYYSYNSEEWYKLDISQNGDITRVPVYTNGYVYFKILDSNDNIIYTQTFNVSGLPSISGYEIHEIPAGNYQIYLSNLSSSTGYIYVVRSTNGLSGTFSYLDINGAYLGSSTLSFMSFEDLGVDTVSGDYDYTRISYDFTDYSDTKVVSFNHNSNDTLVLWIKTGVYIDYVNLDDDSSYNCGSDSNISNSSNYSSCKPTFTLSDNGNVITIDDTTIVYGENSTTNFTITLKNMFLQFSKPFLVIGNIFTTFISVIPMPIMYSIYVGFGLLILVIIIKIWL